MEYSIWHEILTSWSTPWGCKNKSCGVLCLSSKMNTVYNVMKHSTLYCHGICHFGLFLVKNDLLLKHPLKLLG